MRFKFRLVHGVLALALLMLLFFVVPTASAKIVGLASKYKPIPDSGQATLKLRCPKGTHVISGGGYTTGGSLDDQLAQSAPFDGRDDDRKPDDGWLASVNGSPPQKMKTFATCSDRLAVVYKHHPSNLTATGSEAAVQCPTGEVAVGGGLTVDGHPRDAAVAVSGPASDHQSWFSWGRFGNGDGVVHAICAHPASGGSKITYHSRTGDIGPDSQDMVTAPCPQGSRLLGGGAIQADFGEFAELELAALDPTNATGSFKKPWTRWEGWLNNGETISVMLTTTAICRG